MNIEAFCDVACPWCFVGMRRLARALRWAGVVPNIRFRAFQVQPGIPADGVAASSFFERKFGTAARAQRIFERVALLGREEGIVFDFSKLVRAPNTALSHRIIQIASSQHYAERVVEALFRGYFEQGVDLCDVSEIVCLLERERVELDVQDLCARLAAGEGNAEVGRDLRIAADYGIGEVPLFIFDQRYALEGLRPIEQFLRMIAKLTVESGPSASASSLA